MTSIRKMILLSLSAVVLLGSAALAEASEWKADVSHSVLTFKVRHLFSKTEGKFEDWSVTMNLDTEKLEEGSVEVTIQTATINTDNTDRDAHLRSPDFFNSEEYPVISFKSSKIEKSGDGYLVHGTLTMLAVSKEISIPMEFLGAGLDPWGGTRAGFSGSVTINRKDFGIEWNKAMDQGGFILGDEVDIDIEIEAMQVDA